MIGGGAVGFSLELKEAMAAANKAPWLAVSVALAVSGSAGIALWFWAKTWRPNLDAAEKIRELEAALKASVEKCAAERQGRIRAQRALRDTLSHPERGNTESKLVRSYPMAPIAVVKSCFSARNGTPRQPLLVPLARASLIFNSALVPPASLEGFEGYSHCWIIFLFHLNTDLDKLWKHPSQSKLKAKVRVPRLKGERVGVFATRSPHRPCPIGLTLAKVEAVHGLTVLLSGVDLVDGTPVLDIKPYLPYCDSVKDSVVPSWVKMDNMLAIASVDFSDDFSSSLSECWSLVGGKSLYSSPDEFRCLIKQVLSWDIRSVSQRNHPHNPPPQAEVSYGGDGDSILRSYKEDESGENGGPPLPPPGNEVVYHLALEDLDVSYRIDSNAAILVGKVSLSSHMQNVDITTA